MKKVAALCIIILCFLPLFLLAGSRVPIDIVVFSDIDREVIEVNIYISEDDAGIFNESEAELKIQYPDGMIQNIEKQAAVSENVISLAVGIDPVFLWHPDTPELYYLDVELKGKDGAVLKGSHRFGMRKIESKGSRLFVNNKPFFARICGHEGEYKIYCRSNDRQAIEKRLCQVKKYGFNTVRHHSHVPSETYMQVADEVGLFVQMEHNRYAHPLHVDPESDDFKPVKQSWTSMITLGRRHPSTFIYSMGNEIYSIDPLTVATMNALYDLAREMDSGVLVLNRSGGNPLNDDFGKYDLIERPIAEYEHIAKFARNGFKVYLRGDRKGRSDEFPIIAHEYPLVASYPNVALADRYEETPWWIQKTLDNARKHGLEHLLQLYVKNSESVQAMCRREMLEEARKFPELDGYSMLRFTDCMSMVSGVVNDFSDPKNVTAEEFLRTNGETVLLCTWNKRTFRYGDPLEAVIKISHHGQEKYTAEKVHWRLMNGPRVLEEGIFDSVEVDAVDVSVVGSISLTVPELHSPARLTLQAVLPDNIPMIENEWHVWAFPQKKFAPEEQESIILWDPARRMKLYTDIYPDFQYFDDKEWMLPPESINTLVISDRWQEPFFDYLENGGRIWIISDKSWPWPEELGIFGMHITRMDPEQQAPPIFPEIDENLTKWMTICSNPEYRQGNSGTIIYPHPILQDFPHQGFCDMQFWPMIYRAKSLKLDEFPPGINPLIRAIDSYHRGRSKGYMIELGVGNGELFISTLNFTQMIGRSASTAYFFNSVLEYLAGPDWNPPVNISVDELSNMLAGYEDKEAALFDELGLRYTTHWQRQMRPGELIVLPIYEAAGLDNTRLDVHWEYAQTQWYLAAQPLEELNWSFENNSEGEFECIFYLGSPLQDIEFEIQIDDQKPLKTVFPGSDSFNDFKELSLDIGPLSQGKHTFRLSVPEHVPEKDGISITIRDIEIREK